MQEEEPKNLQSQKYDSEKETGNTCVGWVYCLHRNWSNGLCEASNARVHNKTWNTLTPLQGGEQEARAASCLGFSPLRESLPLLQKPWHLHPVELTTNNQNKKPKKTCNIKLLPPGWTTDAQPLRYHGNSRGDFFAAVQEVASQRASVQPGGKKKKKSLRSNRH